MDKNNVTPKASPREVLFFELEYIATTGRAALFDAVKKALAGRVDVTPVSFGRTGAAGRPAALIPELLKAAGKEAAGAEELIAAAEEAMAQFFAETAELNKALPPLIKEAQSKNIQVVAMSAWPEEAAETLMKRLGLDEMGVELEAFDVTDGAFPRADHWLRMLKVRNQETLPAIAAVSSQTACKGALTAAATCIAVPDEYTNFEDFSGAKFILESLGDVPVKEIIALVTRR